MEVVMYTQNINTLFASLGCCVGDQYLIGDDCQATLKDILTRLYKEDKYVRGFRRLIANSQILRKDLLPLLRCVKNDYKILDLLMEILENLMTPVECLIPIHIMKKENAGRTTVFQLEAFLKTCKEEFQNPCSTKGIIDYMKLVMKKDQQLSPEGCRSMNLCLLLLRNLLHIPEKRGGAPGSSISCHNQIIWNLFTQQIDKLLIQMMTGSSCAMWCVTIVQLISLLYKDQHTNTIHKLLSAWCDTQFSESSDDESNTSPQDQGSGDSSSSMATSDPTSDSSDSDHQKQHKVKNETEPKHQPHIKQAAQNRMTEILANGVGRKAQVAMRNKHGNSSKNNHPVKHRQQDHGHIHDQHGSNKDVKLCCTSESGLGSSIGSSNSSSCMKMDCGSQEESENWEMQHQESISTSSNEDKEPARHHQKKKPVHMIQKIRYNNVNPPLSSQALHRTKLQKRSKTTTMTIKIFLDHTPSEEDVSSLLTEFTIDFLLKCYAPLVRELKAVVLTNRAVQMDTSHFTWLIMFFLRFAVQLELELEHISPVLAYNVISYLTYEGVNLCEEVEVVKFQGDGSREGVLGKLYLVVASLKEIIFTIESYKKLGHLTSSDREYLRQLEEKIVCTNDLKHLFVLLIRQFDPTVHSHQFLQDLVVANHNLMILIENCPLTQKSVMVEHIKQFATEDVMSQYGVLLTCFEANGEVVNNCIFTMMHHVAGDLDKVHVLFQPSILRSFMHILNNDFKVRDDWSDLMEYVVQKCLKTKQIKVVPTISVKYEGDVENEPSEACLKEIEPAPMRQIMAEWSKEELGSLCWYFSQSMNMTDPIGRINQLFAENYGQNKGRIEIIENLFKEGLIRDDQYSCLMEKEPDSSKFKTIHTNHSEMDLLEGIKAITDYLLTENCEFFIKWLQNCLLEACYAKLLLSEQKLMQDSLVEPIVYNSILQNQPVPLVVWNQELWKVMQMEPTIWLLSVLNFHLPTRAGQARIFARIPSEWTVDHLYVKALILGPIDSNSVKFDPSTLTVIKQCGQVHTPMDQTINHTNPTNITSDVQCSSSLFGFSPRSTSMTEWVQKVKQLKSSHKALEDTHERMSIGDERDWDLTSVCVSEEGARHEDTIDAPSLSCP